MITFLSSPKPFIGNTGTIQRKAIVSWQSVHPDVEVIIYGSGDGVAEACLDMQVQHVPEILSAPSGTPYFNGIITHSRTHARHDVQCYLNCDILVTKEILAVVSSVKFDSYLVVGQRIDLKEDAVIDVLDDWKQELRRLKAEGKASLHSTSGMDYFIFSRNMWEGLPPLVIGRGGYDGALLAYCLRNRTPIINGTLTFPVFHQFHDYGHVQGGVNTAHRGEDAKANIALHRIKHSMPNSGDAQWLLLDGAVVQNDVTFTSDWLRRFELWLRFQVKFERLALVMRLLWRITVGARIFKVKSTRLEDILEVLLVVVMFVLFDGKL